MGPEAIPEFRAGRMQPAMDLVQRIPLSDPERIMDIGCGPGNSTQVLVQRYPEATVVGLDSSAEMIARARQDYPAMEWRQRTRRPSPRRRPMISSSPTRSSSGFRGTRSCCRG